MVTSVRTNRICIGDKASVMEKLKNLRRRPDMQIVFGYQ